MCCCVDVVSVYVVSVHLWEGEECVGFFVWVFIMLHQICFGHPPLGFFVASVTKVLTIDDCLVGVAKSRPLFTCKCTTKASSCGRTAVVHCMGCSELSFSQSLNVSCLNHLLLNCERFPFHCLQVPVI